MTAVINELTIIPDEVILVFDDYHLMETQPVHSALTFLLEHLPPQIHLVIATREDPPLPLARLRARGQLTELRATDLRFTTAEAEEFLNQVMDLDLSADEVAALGRRTEGWIAGLQLAAISMQGRDDAAGFIESFTGSHRFVLDYLIEEVLEEQPEGVRTFLLQTAILDRLCGPLCDTVRFGPGRSATEQEESQTILEMLDRNNLFIVPLDNERRWYRYHHLFAELLRQRLHQRAASSTGDEGISVAELHVRASAWYEKNGLELEAFHHAAAAGDVERAARLMEGEGMPLHFRGAVAPVLDWLASLPATVLDARPSLWVMYASALSMTGQLSGVEAKLQAAEVALEGAPQDEEIRNLVGHIAAIRALLAAAQNRSEAIIAQSRRALDYLHRDNVAVRTATTWKLGIAYQLKGDRDAARQAYREAIATSQASGNTIIEISATTGLGQVQESENELHLAADTYRRILRLVGDPPQPMASEAYLGLARIWCEWNDLEAAQSHGERAIQLMQLIEETDRLVLYEVFLARLKLAQGDLDGAADIVAEAEQLVRQRGYVHHMPEVAVAQVRVLLRQGKVAAAAELAGTYDLPISQARVHLAQGDPSAALAVLGPWRQQVEGEGWKDKRLQAAVLQAVALHARGEEDEAMRALGEALALAAPGGFIRTFVDEGRPMAELLSQAAARGMMPDTTDELLAAFEAEGRTLESESDFLPSQPLIEPLTPRELEVLQLIAQGLSNREIGERLFIALSTVKGHNRNIYSKLQVERRTEAVARARELGLL